MPPDSDKPATTAFADLGEALSGFFDPDWYLSRYSDIAASGIDPLFHFVNFGAAEGRDPNRFFDGGWYLVHYPDVATSGQHPLVHYLQIGASELRNPHPRFDAAYLLEATRGRIGAATCSRARSTIAAQSCGKPKPAASAILGNRLLPGVVRLSPRRIVTRVSRRLPPPSSRPNTWMDRRARARASPATRCATR